MKSAALLKLTAATALCVVLLASCASNSKFYEANGSGFVGPGFFSTNIYEPSNSNFYDIYNLSQRDSETIRIFKSEFNQVNYLQE